MSNRQNRDNTIFLRFIAILLVVNSHMDVLYPQPLFSTGGAIGNSLFFMLSAYGLLLSEFYKPQTFIQYITKRIIRIYPVVWTSVLFLMLPISLLKFYVEDLEYKTFFIKHIVNDPYSIISIIFYPPKEYWFLQALMFFYIIGFFFIKKYSEKKLFYTMLLLLCTYALFYLQFKDYSKIVIEQTMAFKQIFYLMVFLSGIYFASIKNKIKYSDRSDLFSFFMIIFLIYLHKFLMLNGYFEEFQFVQQLLIFPMLYFFLKISKSPFILDFIMRRKYISLFIRVVSAMTLEIYIVHIFVRQIISSYPLYFPVNVLVFIFFVLMISFIFYKGNSKLIQYLNYTVKC